MNLEAGFAAGEKGLAPSLAPSLKAYGWARWCHPAARPATNPKAGFAAGGEALAAPSRVVSRCGWVRWRTQARTLPRAHKPHTHTSTRMRCSFRRSGWSVTNMERAERLLLSNSAHLIAKSNGFPETAAAVAPGHA